MWLLLAGGSIRTSLTASAAAGLLENKLALVVSQGSFCPREGEVSPQSFFVSLNSKGVCHPWKALGRHHRLQLQEGAHCQGLSGAEVLPGSWNDCLDRGGEGERVAELGERGKSCWEAQQRYCAPSGRQPRLVVTLGWGPQVSWPMQHQLLSPSRCCHGLSMLIQKKMQSRIARQDGGCRRTVER